MYLTNRRLRTLLDTHSLVPRDDRTPPGNRSDTASLTCSRCSRSRSRFFISHFSGIGVSLLAHPCILTKRRPAPVRANADVFRLCQCFVFYV